MQTDYIYLENLKRSKKEKRLEDWEEKVLHRQYFRQTKKVRSDQCWAWVQNGDWKEIGKGRQKVL